MASERLIALQAEIEAKQREVERVIAEEAKKNTVPPLIDALEEVMSAKAAETAASRDFHDYGVLQYGHCTAFSNQDLAKLARDLERLYLDGQDPRAVEQNLRALMFENMDAHDAAKDKMHKALLNQAREDAETKRENSNMFETLLAQMAALQARVTTLEEEKAAKDRLAEETIRSLGYSTRY
jgi:hypothetical protein